MSHPNAVPWAAQNNVNIVCNGPSAPVRAITDRYRQEWQQAFGSSGGALPMMGLGRHLVVGETSKEAFEIGQRAFGVWYANLMHAVAQARQSADELSDAGGFFRCRERRHRDRRHAGRGLRRLSSARSASRASITC